jgi:hypothetical protein
MTSNAPTHTPALKISAASSQPARLTMKIISVMNKTGEYLMVPPAVSLAKNKANGVHALRRFF